jgi:hypothetical protein
MFGFPDNLEHLDFDLFDEKIPEVQYPQSYASPNAVASSSANNSGTTSRLASSSNTFPNTSSPYSLELTRESTVSNPSGNSTGDLTFNHHGLGSLNDWLFDPALQGIPLLPQLTNLHQDPAANRPAEHARPRLPISSADNSPAEQPHSRELSTSLSEVFRPSKKHRRSSQQLPEITVRNPHDPVDVKRARNTEAARRSRQRKVEMLEQGAAFIRQLEERNRQLTIERDFWRLQAHQLGHQRNRNA